MSTTDRSAPTRQPTGADVARLAGVSRATVSYAMNDVESSRVPPETRERVRDIARQLGYAPRSDARSLRTGRTDLVILPAHMIPFGSLVQHFVDNLARSLLPLNLTLVVHGDPDTSGVEAARMWSALRPAAVFVPYERLGPEGAAELTARGSALIALHDGDGPLPASGAALVLRTHQADAAAVATRHLLEQGCEDIAVVVPKEPGLAYLGAERLAAVRGAARGAARVRMVRMAGELASAERLVHRWSTRGTLPDAVYGYNDEYAALLLGAFADAGVDVPGRVRVIGTDDLGLCEAVRPMLSSVAYDMVATVGELAAAIADAVAEPGVPRDPMRVWTPSLRARASTA